MKRHRLGIALILIAILAHPTLSMAFYTRGDITPEVSYDRLAVTPPPSDADTYTPVVSGILVNNTREKISLAAELSFCNVFGEPLGVVTLHCTLPPDKKASFEKRITRNTPAAIKDAHHVEWTVIRLKKG